MKYVCILYIEQSETIFGQYFFDDFTVRVQERYCIIAFAYMSDAVQMI